MNPTIKEVSLGQNGSIERNITCILGIFSVSNNFIISTSEEEFVEKALALIYTKVEDILERTDSCVLALSGGSTPRKVYNKLGKMDLDWDRIRLIQVDERWVPYDDSSNNARMIEQEMGRTVMRIRTDRTPTSSAEYYEQELRKLLHSLGKEQLDLIVLGMGTDGHSASIFPDIPDFENYIQRMEKRLVIAHEVPSQGMWRVTLTPYLLSQSTHTILLLKGEEKGKTFASALNSNDKLKFPVLMCLSEDTTTVLDSAAYKNLKFS